MMETGLKHSVRVNHAGCMNQRGQGPMVTVYPQDVWYAGVSVEGGRRIVAGHLVGGRPVERHRYHAPSGDNER
jgi:(2Fe-2S) ferredoxin